MSITPLRTEALVSVLSAHHPLADSRQISLAGRPFLVHPVQQVASVIEE
ncbi:hypothetical protein ABT381_00360 [Streptomyces sp. NPDC000151]